MPQDRLLHPRQSQSEKVSALDDLAYRVWIATLLHANDYGVLPDSAASLRGQVYGLQRRSEEEIAAALDRCCEAGLLLRFEHQQRRWFVHPSWQDHQKIRFPRGTYYPVPPDEVLRKCSGSTSVLFRKHFRRGSVAVRKDFAETSPAVSRLPLAVSRKTLDRPAPPPAGGFDAFWDAYPRKVAKGAAAKAWRAKKPPLDRVLAALAAQTPLWTDPKYIPHPATWLNAERWLDQLQPTPNGAEPNRRPETVLASHMFNQCPQGKSGFCLKTEYLASVRGATPEADQCDEHRGR